MNDVSCIVVHHNSPSTLTHTLVALVAAGVPGARILVVDNSSAAPDSRTSLALPGISESEIAFHHMGNRGYAAAVNEGLRILEDAGELQAFVLVSTHESLAQPGSVEALREAFDRAPSVAVAGPTLVNAESADGALWSTGGYLTQTLKLPRHFRDSEAVSGAPEVVDREWLDGAFAMYRTACLLKHRFDESYFLYFEETDLHLRLRRSSFRVVWVPRATVSQSSSGIPPRLLGRNLFLFHSRHFSRGRGRVAVSFEAIRALARFLVTRRGALSDPVAIAVGWREGERLSRSG